MSISTKLNKFQTTDDVLLYCVNSRKRIRTLSGLAQKMGISLESLRMYFLNKQIDFSEIKRYLKKIDFIDNDPWWKDQYIFEEGEECRLYKLNTYVTNYGTPLAKKTKKFGGHVYSKFVEKPQRVEKALSRIWVNLGIKLHKREYLHKVVATVWLKKPKGAKIVRHKNGNTLDNHYWNLLWV